MDAGGLTADEQLLGDLAIGTTLNQQAQHLNLTWGQPSQSPLRRHTSAKIQAATAGQQLQRTPKRLGA